MTNTIKILIVVVVVIIIGAATAAVLLTQNDEDTTKVPGAPTGLDFVANGDDLVFNWTAPTDTGSGITGYKLYRSTTSGSYSSTPILTLTGIGAIYTNTTALGTYYFVVKAYNGGGQSSASNEVNVTITRPPGSPTQVYAVADESSIILSWSAPSDAGSGITGYHVYRSKTSGSYGATPNLIVYVNQTVDDNLDAGKYFYIIKAYNSVGEGPASTEVNATVEEEPIITPNATMSYVKDSSGNYTITLMAISANDVAKSSVTIVVSPGVGAGHVGSWIGTGDNLVAGMYFAVGWIQPGQTYTVSLIFDPTDGVMASSTIFESPVLTPTASIIVAKVSDGNYTFTIVSVSSNDVPRSSVSIVVIPDVGADHIGSWVGTGDNIVAGDSFSVGWMQPGQSYSVALVYQPTSQNLTVVFVSVPNEESILKVGAFLKYQLTLDISSDIHNVTLEILGINETMIFYKQTEEYDWQGSHYVSMNYYNESRGSTAFDANVTEGFMNSYFDYVGVDEVTTKWGNLSCQHFQNDTAEWGSINIWVFKGLLIKVVVVSESATVTEMLIDTNIAQITG